MEVKLTAGAVVRMIDKEKREGRNLPLPYQILRDNILWKKIS